jgi:hypothetical protein
VDSVHVVDGDDRLATANAATEWTRRKPASVADDDEAFATRDALVSAYRSVDALAWCDGSSDGNGRATELRGAGIRCARHDLERLLCTAELASLDEVVRTDARR